MNHLKIIAWLCGDDTGMSSKHMAAVACGPPGNGYWPRDPSDLGRCIRLVEAVPEIRYAFLEIAASAPRWAAVIAHWDELRALYESEKTSGIAPKTYARMKQLGL